MRVFFLTFVLITLNSFLLIGQRTDYGSTTNRYSISSDEEKVYQLKVTLPQDYDENKDYRTLYYLDSWWLSEIVMGSYALLTISEKIDDVVLVGISLDGSLLDWNIQRTFDFTPSKYNMPVSQTVGMGENAIPLNENTTGGGEKFIEFLETKVLKFIDDKYPNLSKNRGLLGHSFGGLFGFYVIQNRPALFSDFIIISPALWWNKSELLQEELFSEFKEDEQQAKLYLSYGEDEFKWIVSSNIEMDNVINNLGKSRLDYKFVAYDKTNHNSILPKAIYDGLMYLYGR
jgi:predicted alpha/beta superfamily hydrolase